MSHTVGSHQLNWSERALLEADRQGGTAARSLHYGVHEGGDGDEICMDAEVLLKFLDEQSRSLRDFIRFAREG